MKNAIKFLTIVLLCSLSFQINFRNHSTEKFQNNSDQIKIFVTYEFLKDIKRTKIRLLIRRKNLQVVDLGTYKGIFNLKKLSTQENLPQEFFISSNQEINTFKLFRKSDSIILMRMSKDLANNEIYTTILKTIPIDDSRILVLQPVEVKENPRAL